jgi:glycosyltransferase involved in cell wall biosynthesis
MRIERPVGLKRRPSISVVIPCYKYGHFLPQAVSSALDQEGVDVDVLIVDDASPDGSADVARRLASQDERVKVLVHESNQGHIRTYNDGLELATGDYTVLLSADDLVTPGALTRAAELMESHPSVGLVYGAIQSFTGSPSAVPRTGADHWAVWPGREWARSVFTDGRNRLASPEAVVRTTTMKAVGLYDPEQPHAGDLQMWLRLAAVSDVGYVAGPLQAFYRLHESSLHSATYATDAARGMVTDLEHRLFAFTSAAGAFPDGADLLAAARHATAVEAVDLAARAFVWGLTDTWPVDALIDYALDTDPAVTSTRAWRALHLRQRVGRRWARRNPAFVAREKLLNLGELREERQMRQTGLPATAGAGRPALPHGTSLSGDGRRGAGLEWRLMAKFTPLVDFGPDVLRFGKGRSVRRLLWSRPLLHLPPTASAVDHDDPHGPARPLDAEGSVVLVTRSLGTGGVEAILATLARGLPSFGVGAVVLCEVGGATADALRADGIEVVECRDQDSAEERLALLPEGTVAELHNAPAHLVAACLSRDLPLIPVIHSTDMDLSLDQWEEQRVLADSADVSIAVSETVRDFFTHHLPGPARSAITVIPNGVAMTVTDVGISASRSALSRLLSADLEDAIVFSCLARYNLQKNIAGLVASFIGAAEEREDVRLVVAGPVDDWLEYELADALRRASNASDRIHLLGTSDPAAVLAASDAFILDSFFEGWPVAATEAVAAGLPLLISEVGGASELVDQGRRGLLFDNPAAAPQRLDYRSIQRARRSVDRQPNRLGLQHAVLSVAESIDDWRARRAMLSTAARESLAASRMIQSHARVILDHREGA